MYLSTFNYNINLNVGYSKSGNVPNAGSQQVYFNPFRAALHGLPYMSPYDADGSTTIYGGLTPGGQFDLQHVPLILLNSMSMNTNKTHQVKSIRTIRMMEKNRLKLF